MSERDIKRCTVRHKSLTISFWNPWSEFYGIFFLINPLTTGLLPFGNMTHNCWVIRKKSCLYILFDKSLFNLDVYRILVLALGGSLWYRHLSLILINFQTDLRTLKSPINWNKKIFTKRYCQSLRFYHIKKLLSR